MCYMVHSSIFTFGLTSHGRDIFLRVFFQTDTARVAPHWLSSGTLLLSVAIRAGYERLSDHNAVAFQDPLARQWTFMISFSHRTGAFNGHTVP